MAKDCKFDNCGAAIPVARAKLGFDTCITHGAVKKVFPVALQYNKGPYGLVTPKMNPRHLGKKG